MPNKDDKVLIGCEIAQPDIIAFLAKCEREGCSFSEKIEELIKNFLHRGDNHLLKKVG